MGTSDTLRSVIDAGRSSKRLDELSSARVIGKIALQIHAAQQKAGSGKAVGPVTPIAITFAPSGDVKLALGEGSALGYSAPEQLTGAGDRRSDVFSLGAVLWEALTHQRLFDAMNDAAVRIAVQERPIQPPAEVNANVPAELSAICMRALSRNPADRYQSLKSMAVEIEEFLSEAGYEDNDDKIAQYLESLSQARAVKIEMASMPRPAGGTQPPPTGGPLRSAAASQPPATRPANASQPPSILTSPPSNEPRPKSNSGAALAAALANASSSQTALGVPSAPVASDWQDKSAPPAHAAPAVASVAPATPATSIAAAEPAVPLTPLPPVLPGQTPIRNDKSTIAVSVPPQVRVATNAAIVDAKHTEAKPAALIVDEKPKALIVEDEPKPAATKDNPKETAPGTGLTTKAPAKDTVPDGKLPVDIRANGTPTAKPMSLEEKLAAAEAKVAAAAETKPVSALEAPPVKEAVAKAATPASTEKPDDKNHAKHEAKPAATHAPSESEATRKRAPSEDGSRKRAPSQDGSRRRSPSQGGTGPNPVAAVSLGPAPRDSKGDLLAGWGWGTDKHDAIAPDGYLDHDEPFEEHTERSRKTLMYMIGGGVAFAAMVTIVALLAGGSKGKKKERNKPVASARENEAAAPAPTPDPLPPTPTATAGSAAPANDTAGAPAAGSAVIDQAATDKAAADKAAADQAAADKAAADKAAADKAAADKAAADKAAAEADKRTAAEKAAADRAAAEAEKKAAAAQAAADKKAAAEAAKQAAAEKKALADAEKKAAAEKAAASRKAAAEKLAAERKAAAEKAATAKANEPKTKTETRPKDAKTKADTKVAKAETKTEGASKVDVETAYRQGLQQFARGDTAGALASLRTSLAGNPNYAPTWRGLGLVFEKMGEKEQARAAYKRYLQLSPNATDAEQIKGRLERLGT